MRIVVDTNILVSGFLWGGVPLRVLELARSKSISIISSEPLIAEFTLVIFRDKFTERFQQIGRTPDEFLADYRNLVEIVQPAEIEPVVLNDPPDDAVLACALGGNAEYIISGNRHLLNLNSYHSIPIMTATNFLELIATSDSD